MKTAVRPLSNEVIVYTAVLVDHFKITQTSQTADDDEFGRTSEQLLRGLTVVGTARRYEQVTTAGKLGTRTTMPPSPK